MAKKKFIDPCSGITCPPEPAEIVKAILTIYNMSEDERSAMGAKGKEYVLQNHTYSVLAEKFIEAMK